MPLYVIFRKIFISQKIKISSINFNGTEANFSYDENEESILYKDIKEIVYLLKSSESKIFVVEDLDRYGDIKIFTKLRELNLMLNNFIKMESCNDNGSVKFIYMIRDGLFISEDRTKFFDFIIPIIPVVDYTNSETKIIELLKQEDILENGNLSTDGKVGGLSKQFIYRISIYINDMRLLKNILNEFFVYKEVLNSKILKLDSEKIFSLVLLKNVYPRDFEMLQRKSGIIFNIFKNLDEKIKHKEFENNNKIKQHNDLILKIKDSINNADYNLIVSNIPESLKISNPENMNRRQGDILREMYKFRNEKFYLNVYDSSNYLNQRLELTFDDLVNAFNFKKKDFEKELNKIIEEKRNRILEIEEKINDLNLEMEILKSNNNRDIFKLFSDSDVDEIFKITSHNLKEYAEGDELIRVLIINGYIDKSYEIYKSIFYPGGLHYNDMIFYREIMEGKKNRSRLGNKKFSRVD